MTELYRQIAIYEDGDWNLNSLVFDDKAIQQDIVTRLREWKNDCFFSRESGIDYINIIGSLDPSINEFVNVLIQNVILTTRGVVDITNTTIVNRDNLLTIKYNVTTVFSTSIQGIVNI